MDVPRSLLCRPQGVCEVGRGSCMEGELWGQRRGCRGQGKFGRRGKFIPDSSSGGGVTLSRGVVSRGAGGAWAQCRGGAELALHQVPKRHPPRGQAPGSPSPFPPGFQSTAAMQHAGDRRRFAPAGPIPRAARGLWRFPGGSPCRGDWRGHLCAWARARVYSQP